MTASENSGSSLNQGLIVLFAAGNRYFRFGRWHLQRVTKRHQGCYRPEADGNDAYQQADIHHVMGYL